MVEALALAPGYVSSVPTPAPIGLIEGHVDEERQRTAHLAGSRQSSSSL